MAPLVPHPAASGVLSTAAFVGVAAVGALLPDLDMPGAKASKLLGPVTWALAWLVNKLSVAVFKATRTPKDRGGVFPGHRTLTHTALWGVLTSAAAFLGVASSPVSPWAPWAALAVAVGHFAHLWGDSITLGGIPLWAPLWKRGGQRWHCVHSVPKPLRFRVGAHHDGKQVPGHSRWAWINLGEGAVTLGLAGLTAVLAALAVWSGTGVWWTGLGMVLG